MPENDEFTLSLLTNDEVLAVNQDSSGNRELFWRGDRIGWVANVPGCGDKYVALFNLSDDIKPVRMKVVFRKLRLAKKCHVRDLWKRRDIGCFEKVFMPLIPAHGAGLYRIREY